MGIRSGPVEYQQGLAACEHKGIGRTRSADEALAHRRIGNALDRLGRFAQAEMHYKKALRLSPRDPKIWNDAGYSYYLQGRWADAERTFKSGSRLAPEDVKLKTNLGLTLAAAGRTKEALPLLSQYSGDAIGHANLGFLLAATGQVELARQQYLQALALRPSLALARRALAQLDRARDAEAVAAAGQPPRNRSSPLPQGPAMTPCARPRPRGLGSHHPASSPLLRRLDPRCQGRESESRDSASAVGFNQRPVESRAAIGDPVHLVAAGHADQVLRAGADRVGRRRGLLVHGPSQ